MGEHRTQAERRAESRCRLIMAAMTLLAERGYARSSLVEIGRAAGLSRGLVSHHFGSKEACMQAVVECIREHVQERTARAMSSSGDALDHLMDTYFDGIARREPGALAMYVILIEGITATPGLRAAVAETNALTRAFITQTVATLFSPHPSPALDHQILAVATVAEGIMRGVSLQWLADPENIDLTAARDTAKAMIRPVVTALQPSARRSRAGIRRHSPTRSTATGATSHTPSLPEFRPVILLVDSLQPRSGHTYLSIDQLARKHVDEPGAGPKRAYCRVELPAL